MANSFNQDRFRKEGAEVLARTIMRYWRNLGETVKAWAEPLTDMVVVEKLDSEARRSDEILYVVRSDMIDGRPRPVAKLAEAA